MEQFAIKCNGKVFPAVEITIFPDTDEEQIVVVPVLSLNNELWDGEKYLFSGAQRIDDEIFYYLDDDKINLPEDEIRKILEDAF